MIPSISQFQALISAVRLDENTKYSDYILKTHQAFLLRELNTQGEEKIESMLCGYTHRLLKKFAEHDFTFVGFSLTYNSHFFRLLKVFTEYTNTAKSATVLSLLMMCSQKQ